MIWDEKRWTGLVSVRRIFDTRSRADSLNRIFSGQALPSRHPDNAPGQDPYPSRKRDRREENRQSLFSFPSSLLSRPSHCHPELVSGSGLLKAVAGGWELERPE
jgi:hypothetical protein